MTLSALRSATCSGLSEGKRLYKAHIRSKTAKFSYIEVFFHWSVWYTRFIPVNRNLEGSKMKHKVKVTVLDKKLYPELQQQYCAEPSSGACPCYNVGDEFMFYRDDKRDDFWHMGLNTLIKTAGDADTVAGGSKIPFCSEAWDAISRYIYTGLQGGSIMKGWMKNENEMIACCSDGTRPVIFKIERIDYE